MKKYICIILIIVLLFGAIPAGAANISGISEDNFVFRDGIKWSMSKEEIRAIEKGNELSLFLTPRYGYDAIGYDNVTFSRFTDAYLLYFFYNDQLSTIMYMVEDGSSSSVEYIYTALTQKYGNTAILDYNEKYDFLKNFYAQMNALSYESPGSVEELTREEIEEFNIFWKTSDNTLITLLPYDEGIIVLYSQPVQEIIDTNGL